MLHKMYTVRDSKSDTYTPPMCQITHGVMEREFKMVVNDPKTQFGKHPEDYDLYYLGTYDDNTGKMDLLDSPQHMVKAVNLLDPKQ